MSRKLSALILALSLSAAITACKGKENKDGTPPAAADSKSVTSLHSGTITPPAATYPNSDKPVAHPEPMLHNAVAGDDVSLPADVPAFPKAELTGKRITNATNIFDYKADANMREVLAFYTTELKNQQWLPVAQQPNSTDGLYFKKVNRTVRVIAFNKGPEKKCEIHLFVTSSQKATDAKEDPVSKYVGNLSDLIRDKMPKSIPADVPIYENSQRKMTTHPGKWYEFKSKDTVQTINDWYTKKMTEGGWSVELDTSELGDAMRIFQKDDGKGNKRKVGIRINNKEQEKERWFTIILYPDNIVVPQVEAPSKLAQKQGGSAGTIEDAVKRARAQAAAKQQQQKN